MMYNEQLKLAFAEKYTENKSTRKLVIYIFEGIGNIEVKYGVDFYSMNVAQAQEAFDVVSGMRSSGAGAIHMILRAYIRWCKANGYQTTQAVDSLRFEAADKIRETHVASPQHLKKSLDEAFPHPETNEIEYIYRAFLWLGFIGLQVSEAIQVTPSHIDFESMLLRYPDKEHTHLIYAEAVNDLRKACSLKELKDPRTDAKGNHVVKQRAPGQQILRGKVSEKPLDELIDITFRPTISRAFRAALDRYKKQNLPVPPGLSLRLSFKPVYMSGIFYRIYERERSGIIPVFDEIVLQERRNAKKSEYHRNYTPQKHLNILIRDMEQDYDNWKSVFS